MPDEVTNAMREMAQRAAAAGAGPPVTAREVPRAEAPPPARIAAGSLISLRSADQVCTDKTKEGARFRGIVQDDVEGENGGRIHKGSVVTFVVASLKRGNTPTEKTDFSVAAQSVQINGSDYPLEATTDAVTIKAKSRGLFGALAGAAVGAAAAKAGGGDTKQAIAGGVVGGAAGAVVGGQLKTGDGCIEKNAPIRITLQSAVTLN
jgi:hypothetical protein